MLEEIKIENLHKLKDGGYKYLIHTTPTSEEELALQCCEAEPVKYIPVKNMEEAEDLVRTYPDSYKLDFEEAEKEVSENRSADELKKFYIGKEYV